MASGEGGNSAEQEAVANEWEAAMNPNIGKKFITLEDGSSVEAPEGVRDAQEYKEWRAEQQAREAEQQSAVAGEAPVAEVSETKAPEVQEERSQAYYDNFADGMNVFDAQDARHADAAEKYYERLVRQQESFKGTQHEAEYSDKAIADKLRAFQDRYQAGQNVNVEANENPASAEAAEVKGSGKEVQEQLKEIDTRIRQDEILMQVLSDDTQFAALSEREGGISAEERKEMTEQCQERLDALRLEKQALEAGGAAAGAAEPGAATGETGAGAGEAAAGAASETLSEEEQRQANEDGDWLMAMAESMERKQTEEMKRREELAVKNFQGKWAAKYPGRAAPDMGDLTEMFKRMVAMLSQPRK